MTVVLGELPAESEVDPFPLPQAEANKPKKIST
jgi:hypothetical protein